MPLSPPLFGLLSGNSSCPAVAPHFLQEVSLEILWGSQPPATAHPAILDTHCTSHAAVPWLDCERGPPEPGLLAVHPAPALGRHEEALSSLCPCRGQANHRRGGPLALHRTARA